MSTLLLVRHGLTKMTNRRAKMEWDLAWFDKYLKRK